MKRAGKRNMFFFLLGLIDRWVYAEIPKVRGTSRIFLRRGFPTQEWRLLTWREQMLQNTCYTGTRRSSWGGGGTHPLYPPPRSAPVIIQSETKHSFHTAEFGQQPRACKLPAILARFCRSDITGVSNMFEIRCNLCVTNIACVNWM